MKVVALGLSHRTAPIEVREKLAQSHVDVSGALAELRKGSTITEACIVSTCNRVELYLAGDAEPTALARDARNYLEAAGGFRQGQLDGHLYIHEGAAGLRHLFRVSSSLDSMVLGEPQILGQVKEAFKKANDAGAVGAVLGRAFQKAFAIAKRIRTETAIAQNAVSMSFAAVELGKQIFTSLDGKSVLLVGAGKMSTLAAKHLRSSGIAEIRVANRSLERATQLAQEIGGTASSLDDLEILLARADIVISSTAAPHYVIDKKLMSKVVKARRYKPILLIDLAVPRDVDPAIAGMDQVFVYDVDDLEEVVDENRTARAREAEAAERIIEDELAGFVRWARSQQVVPVIKALREKVTSLAAAEVERTVGGLKTDDPKVAESVRAMANAIVNKLLHPVQTQLKQAGADGDPDPLINAVTALFALEIADEPPPADEPAASGAKPEQRKVVPIR